MDAIEKYLVKAASLYVPLGLAWAGTISSIKKLLVQAGKSRSLKMRVRSPASSGSTV